MKKTKLLITSLIITSSLFMTGCAKKQKVEKIEIDTSNYITENVKITNADDALNTLKDGNKRFKDNNSQLINVTSERRDQLKDGQSPYAIVVSCSDSRTTPETVFNAGLGEIFDIRLAGNVVDDDALGSIEYGVDHLGTPLIVVMGHEKCGAVTAAYDNVTKGAAVHGNVVSIVEKIKPSAEKATSLDEAINLNIKYVINEISNDEIIKKAIDDGKVKVVGAYYSFDGTVNFLS